MKQRIRVLIADDRSTSRKGLRALLSTQPEVEIVGEATDGRGAVCQVRKLCPDVVLMDVSMPVMDGLEATRLIRARWPAVKVIVLTMYDLRRDDALAAGASAFLVKGCPTQELLDAITLEDRPRATPLNKESPRRTEKGAEALDLKLSFVRGTA